MAIVSLLNLNDYDVTKVGLKHRYSVTVTGGSVGTGRGGFSKVSGIRGEIEVVDQRDGTDPLRTRKLVGAHSGSDCTLEKGVFAQKTFLIDWFKSAKGGVDGAKLVNFGYKRTVQIDVFGTDGTIIRTVKLFSAWPHSYELGELDGNSSGVAVEFLVLAFEDLDIT